MSTDVMPNTKTGSKIKIRTIAQVGMLAAIATVIMLFEIPLPFAPSFYELDLSEVPVLVGCFAMGPIAGAVIELVKIILNFVINGTITGGVGEFANLMIGCALCVPAGIIYRKNRTRKGAIIGLITGTVFMTVIGCLLNAYVLLPVYAKVFQMPLDALVEFGTKINPAITSLSTFVMFAVAPFNILKGVVVSAITILIYKKISPIFKM
ncbi:ECF transporter S component [Lachnospiraceae bacterium LCP25S3_G4]